ncbi:conserved hypothetical protein [Thiocapsa sp. KS1]|nr:hypothetical protein [Thiocapsa sp. KS1]CRI67466.1 conserved hypothetical protein [Thiocapsa sp. KS1]
MERVAFLVEETNARLRCMLNPESLVFRREAGVRRRDLPVGTLGAGTTASNSVLFTGGGQTELEFDLVFDVSLSSGSTILAKDVRALTAPIWALAENGQRGSGGGAQPPIARFVWGKSWNIRGVVQAVAERLENFDVSGIPRRSWMRLRMLQIPEDIVQTDGGLVPERRIDAFAHLERLRRADRGRVEQTLTHRVVQTGGTPEDPQVERLDQLAQQYYGNAALWRLIAVANSIEDPARLSAGMVLDIPPQPRD